MDDEERHGCAAENTFGYAALHPAVQTTASMRCQGYQVTGHMGAFPFALGCRGEETRPHLHTLQQTR